MLNLYQEILMDHYRNPRNNGVIEQPNLSAQQRNSSCGDEVFCTGIIKDKVLLDVAFCGKGCVISQSTASLLSECVKNRPLDDILALGEDDLVIMLAMPLGPVRLLCALLSLTALQNGVKDYRVGRKE
jgi:nitrogen fixation NifU-like protein